MIALYDVRKVFSQGKANEFVALHGVSLSIEANRITVIKGPSGSGKTTLLSLIGCMSRPSSGRIFIRDREVTSLPERFLTEIRQKTFGFIFQQFNLLTGISTIENVMLPAYPLGVKHSTVKKRAMDLLDLFGISSKAHAKVESLSGGEAQRAAIARALINDPSVIIADEPTAHLDTKRSMEFMDILTNLKENGKTILIASHDPLIFDSHHIASSVSIRDGSIEAGD